MRGTPFILLRGKQKSILPCPEGPRQCPPVLVAAVGWKLGETFPSEEDEWYLHIPLVPHSKHFPSKL
jgi:hypothetical protein